MAATKPMKIGDATIQAKTGRTWSEWLAALDAAGADRLDHKGIVAVLAREHDISAWWQQMIAVAYEQARGLRDKHQKPDGYAIGRSKTVGVGVEELFAAWSDGRRRRAWLAEAGARVRKATPERSMRISWPDGTSLDVYFVSKGEGKSQVSVEHQRLPDAHAAERQKAFWGEALDRMKRFLER